MAVSQLPELYKTKPKTKPHGLLVTATSLLAVGLT